MLGLIDEQKAKTLEDAARLAVLRYNLADRKTLQFYKLKYFIEQRVMFLT